MKPISKKRMADIDHVLRKHCYVAPESRSELMAVAFDLRDEVRRLRELLDSKSEATNET